MYSSKVPETTSEWDLICFGAFYVANECDVCCCFSDEELPCRLALPAAIMQAQNAHQLQATAMLGHGELYTQHWTIHIRIKQHIHHTRLQAHTGLYNTPAAGYGCAWVWRGTFTA